MDDVVSGQVPKLFVQLKKDAIFRETELMNFLRERLDISRMPRYIEVIESIPRTQNGKIKRMELR